ncbi:MAG: hypothetical protein QM640_00480 [Niabella sp.]
MKRSFLPFAVIIFLIIVEAVFFSGIDKLKEAHANSDASKRISRTILSYSLPQNNLGIIIQNASSTQIDLIENVYTVYMWGLSDSTKQGKNIVIPFSLTSEEDKRIRKKFYALKLNELPDSIVINDKVEMFPYVPTTITIHTNNCKKIIEFEYGKDYDDKNGYKIRQFLDLINEIIFSKPEIKNAPKSDVHYM